MKQAMMILGLLLLTAIVAVSSAQDATKQAKPKKVPARPAPETVRLPPREDLDGKPVKADEPFLAQRALKNGHLIVYRKNERDVAALVKGLKEDGVTDAKLLDPKSWMLWTCQAYGNKKCSGKCGNQQCVWVRGDVDTARVGWSAVSVYQGYCACR